MGHCRSSSCSATTRSAYVSGTGRRISQWRSSPRCVRANMLVLRPADAIRAARCWGMALERRSGPEHAGVRAPTLPDDAGADHGREPVAPRRHVLAGAQGRRTPCDAIFNSGSSSRCARAKRLKRAALFHHPVDVRTDAAERFDAQDAAYRAQVLGSSDGVRWWRQRCVPAGTDTSASAAASSAWAGSAPGLAAEQLYEHFGIRRQQRWSAQVERLLQLNPRRTSPPARTARRVERRRPRPAISTTRRAQPRLRMASAVPGGSRSTPAAQAQHGDVQRVPPVPAPVVVGVVGELHHHRRVVVRRHAAVAPGGASRSGEAAPLRVAQPAVGFVDGAENYCSSSPP